LPDPGFTETWVVLSNVAGKVEGLQSAVLGAVEVGGGAAAARIQNTAGLEAAVPYCVPLEEKVPTTGLLPGRFRV
jgi:hypothetical protein